jgi:hypothetical protein
MIDVNGKILLDENGMVKEASNGHGGTLESMDKRKVIEELKNNGVEWVFISGVDNVLAKLVDPLLIGMSIHNNVLGAVKSVEKTDPKERVGVFCRKNKKVGVVEYTEISEEMANMRDDYGSLVYGDLNAVFEARKGLAQARKEAEADAQKLYDYKRQNASGEEVEKAELAVRRAQNETVTATSNFREVVIKGNDAEKKLGKNDRIDIAGEKARLKQKQSDIQSEFGYKETHDKKK